jgi:hypothetical protein
MKTKDIIKDALRDFDGTLILVSHDRRFDGLSNQSFEFKNKRVIEHLKIYLDSWQTRKWKSMREIENRGITNKQPYVSFSFFWIHSSLIPGGSSALYLDFF